MLDLNAKQYYYYRMSQVISNTQGTILDRALSSIPSGMSVEAAKYFLSIALTDSDRQRTNDLAAKARAGSLTSEEQSELDEYRRAGRTIEMLRIRAKSVVEQAK